MASRRPPTSKNSLLPANRPRSAMAKPMSVNRGGPSTADDYPELPALHSSLPHSKSSKSIGLEGETNIQVVIRCRRRSDREVQESTPIIVSSKGAKSQDVTIETSAPISSLGVITLAPTRTYPFDLVFGPEADQAMIYHEVVSPMLDEVLQGYNCTLFAYGQTGTGKTYTMQGDLTPTPMGNPSAQAGMIPRVLFRLFHHLEATASDYSVKISYIELYNEELRDLLANDLSAPTGSAQPMSKGTGSNSNSNSDANNGLKIFDDQSKKGVFIQGLEEMLVKDAPHALALLTKGSYRRQIAATKFNDHSSRSHSVFSITVHIKETSSMGDDLLKIGKLNLVDLAGSENIGRSGAENKRAREAGMINQSLLTLGRVINALVDKSSHVPYRESKLTRLLQDSLGGRTKTCIIATVSPARSNMEETLSTLDYAMRAKSIRNKPELNQRMTRNSLLKEYVVEIERLKADVLAAREKNGIFFSEETWNQLSADQELKQTEMEEAKKQVEIMESQLRSVREEFEQSIGLLMKRDGELRETKERLKAKEDDLQSKAVELTEVKVALQEETVVRQAHQGSEQVLDGVAHDLKKIVGESIIDVGGLFEKIQRKSSVSTSNAKAVSKHGKSILTEIKALQTKLDDFAQKSSQNTVRLLTEANSHKAKELEVLVSQSTRVDSHLLRLQQTMKVIQSKEAISADALAAIQNAVNDAQETFKNSFEDWSIHLQKNCDAIYKELHSNGINYLIKTEDGLKALGSLVDAIILATQEYIHSQREAVLEARVLAQTAAASEIARLREQNTLLSRLLESEMTKAEQAKNVLISRVSGLLGEFTSARDHSLQNTISSVQADNLKAEEDMSHFGVKHSGMMDSMVAHGIQNAELFEKNGGESKRTRNGALKALSSAQLTLKSGVSTLQTSMSASLQTYSKDVQQRAHDLSSTCNNAFDHHGRAKRARIEAFDAVVTEAQSEYGHIQRNTASSSRSIETFSDTLILETNRLATGSKAYYEAAGTGLASIHKTAQSLIEQGTREDVPTGLTPRKRVWEYVDQWELTESRDAVLTAWRKRSGSVTSVDTIAEKRPASIDTTVDTDVDDDQDEMAVGQVELHPGQENLIHSPIPVSLESSLSSAAEPPLPQRPPLKKATNGSRSGLPILGTLTDRPTNVTTQRTSRRLR